MQLTQPTKYKMQAFEREVSPYVKAFEQTQERWIDLGASDTEPDSAFQLYIFEVACKHGRRVDDLPTVYEWHLFPRDGEEQACRELNKAARAVAEVVIRFRDAAAKVYHSDLFDRVGRTIDFD
jgi:hypothetical protein